MLRKASPKNDAVDVPADNPDGTMARFSDGLRRVLSAPKPIPKRRKGKTKKR